MDYQLTFALLLYFNIFYFGLFAVFEFCLLMFKAYNLLGSKYNSTTLINELFILTFMTVVESVRLTFGQQHKKDDFDKKLASVFRILVLTVPSMYSVAYFTFWQNYLSRLDVALGCIMLIIQACQLFSSFFIILPKYMPGQRAKGGGYRPMM